MISVLQLSLRAMVRTGLLSLALLGLSAAVPPAAGSAATPPAAHLSISSSVSPTHLVPGETVDNYANYYVVTVENTGAVPTDGSAITIEPTLPAGFTPNSELLPNGFVYFQGATDGKIYDCEVGPPITCTAPGLTLQPGQRYFAIIALNVPANASDPSLFSATVSGGGAPAASTTLAATVSADPAPPGFQSAFVSASGLAGEPVTQAGSHPYALHLDFQVNTVQISEGAQNDSVGQPEDLLVHLPRGFVLNPQAIPSACTEAQVALANCPASTAVGVIHIHAGQLGLASPAFSDPLYRMKTAPGAPAEFGFSVKGWAIVTHIRGGVDASGDYVLTGDVSQFPEFGLISGADVEFWGDPSDPSHDAVRGNCVYNDPSANAPGCPVTQQQTPLLTMPSACSEPLTAGFDVEPWDPAQGHYSASPETTDDQSNPVGVDGCDALEFNPTLQARPTTNVADSPSGLDVDIRVPQNDNVNTLATSNLKKTVVTLPAGLTLNPSAANGLKPCSSSQIGIDPGTGVPNDDPPTCPAASKLGTVEIDTPLLEDPLPGTVYLAAPHDNPFGSQLALYIAVDDPKTGVIIKLPGKVEADPGPGPETGRLTTTFDDNPELPFDDFKLNFYGGAGGALRTPAVCGTYSTTSELTPWSETPPVEGQDEYAIDHGPNGTCPAGEAEQPISPSFDAGSVSPEAAAHTPFVLNLKRDDGTQQFSQVTVKPPPGLVAKLAGTPACSDAGIAQAQSRTASGDGALELSHPSCPAASKVGVVHVGAGAGPAPYYVTGNVYLAGPYKGAPLSFAIITPAVAGPFDLGVVVTRVAITLDPVTAQITAAADPLPDHLTVDGDGFPLDVRSVQLALDKPDFTVNGTSCDPTTLTGSLLSTLGVTSPLSERFQLAECSNLEFKPKFSLKLKGATKRSSHPALKAVLTAKPGEANIAKAVVALPHSEFLAQEHIKTVCTRVQFAADECPASSIYGRAKAWTPLLDYALEGPVYLRSSSHNLPDLVVALRGPAYQPLEIDLDGRIDSIHGGIRNSFEMVPDAPVSRFILEMQGAKKGLLVNSENLCSPKAKKKAKAKVDLTGQNGKVYDTKPAVQTSCKRAKKHHKRHHHGRGTH